MSTPAKDKTEAGATASTEQSNEKQESLYLLWVLRGLLQFLVKSRGESSNDKMNIKSFKRQLKLEGGGGRVLFEGLEGLT